MQTNKTAARQITGKAMVGGAGLGALWALKAAIQERRRIEQFRDDLSKLLERDIPGPKGPGAGAILKRDDLAGDKYEAAVKDLKWVEGRDLQELAKILKLSSLSKEASETMWERLTTPLALRDTPVLRHATTPMAIALPLAILAFGGSKKLVGQLLRQAAKLEDTQRIKQDERRIRDFVETGYPDESLRGVSDKFASLNKEADSEWWQGFKNKLSGWGKDIEGVVAGPAFVPAMLAATLMLIAGSRSRKRSQLRTSDTTSRHMRELTRGLRQDRDTHQLGRLREDLLESVRAGRTSPKEPAPDRGTDEAFVV